MTGGGDLPVHNVLLVACGSYNPVTNMHLRMFELARDALTRTGRFRVLGGLVSPVADAYASVAQLDGLATAYHRLEMIRLALQPPSREAPGAWVRLACWEAGQTQWLPTRRVLDHYQAVMDGGLTAADSTAPAEQSGAATTAAGSPSAPDTDDYRWLTGLIRRLRQKDPLTVAHPMLLCGSDMLKSFAVPGLWSADDLVKILRDYGLIVITKPSCNPQQIIFENDLLNTYEQNIALVTEWTVNQLSSAFVRRALRRRESVRYLLPDPVIEYIYKNALYHSTAERPRPPTAASSSISISTQPHPTATGSSAAAAAAAAAVSGQQQQQQQQSRGVQTKMVGADLSQARIRKECRACGARSTRHILIPPTNGNGHHGQQQQQQPAPESSGQPARRQPSSDDNETLL